MSGMSHRRDYYYRKHGIYGWLAVPAFLGMAVWAYQIGGWLGFAAFGISVGVLTWKAKGLNVVDSFGRVIWPMFILFTIAAFAWSFVRNW